MPLTLPESPAHQSAYDSVRETAPALYAFFESDLVPLAEQGTADAVRQIDARQQERYAAFLADGGGEASMIMGNAWSMMIEDLFAALALAAIDGTADAPAGDRRAQLTALEEAINAAIPGSFTAGRLQFSFQLAL